MSEQLMQRLDAQQAMLEQARQMAMAAEARAETSMQLNRIMMAGVALAAAYIAMRQR